MKCSATLLLAAVLTTSGCAVTARAPYSQSVANGSDIRHLEEFDWEAEAALQKRKKAEKIDRLLKKIRGDGS